MRTREAHEGDGHLNRVTGLDTVNGTGGKGQGGHGPKADQLGRGSTMPGEKLPARMTEADQPNGLKKVELVRALEKQIRYRRICSPVLGCHCFKYPFRCLDRAINWLNELMEL